VPKGRFHSLRGIYAIVDNAGRPERPLSVLAQAAGRAGVKVIQLRAKGLTPRELAAAARSIAALCRKLDVSFIVNDRLDVALAAKADGVHLGQDDLPPAAARRVAGDRLWIGVSTHSIAEARRAERDGADYVGFGAMYGTASKERVTAPQGAGRLREVVQSVAIPVIAIGGITLEKIPEIQAAGAAGAAVISSWVQAPDPAQALREMIFAWQKLDKRNIPA